MSVCAHTTTAIGIKTLIQVIGIRCEQVKYFSYTEKKKHIKKIKIYTYKNFFLVEGRGKELVLYVKNSNIKYSLHVSTYIFIVLFFVRKILIAVFRSISYSFILLKYIK